MLHLAQVQKNKSVDGLELRLLARQHSENTWALINPENVSCTNTDSFNEGMLVLVELSDKQELISIQNAKDWVLDFVHKYLVTGVSPTFLQEEAERIEQWRQDLTLQNQDLTRRHLEMEARREQIQTLEEELKRDKQQLEEKAAQLEARREQIQTLEEELKREKQQLEEKAAEFKNKNDSEKTDSDVS